MKKLAMTLAGLMLALGTMYGGVASAADPCTKPACWGAVGIGPGDAFGYSFHYAERESAVARVRSECTGCDRIEGFENACAAFAKAGNGAVGYATGPDKAGAQDGALSACRGGGGHDCGISVWGCSRRAD